MAQSKTNARVMHSTEIGFGLDFDLDLGGCGSRDDTDQLFLDPFSAEMERDFVKPLFHPEVPCVSSSSSSTDDGKQERKEAARKRRKLTKDSAVAKPVAMGASARRFLSSASTLMNEPLNAAQDTRPPLLHLLCQQYPNEVAIETALMLDPYVANKRASLPSLQDPVRFGYPSKQQGTQRTEDFQYPLNIALCNSKRDSQNIHAVIRLLATAAPEVLCVPETKKQCLSSLHIALQKHPQDVSITNVLLEACASRGGWLAASAKDGHGNTPLHTACQRVCSLEVVKALCQSYPRALDQRNFRGESPLDIATRTLICPDVVVDFLRRSLSQKERVDF